MTLTKAIKIVEIETGSRHIPSDPDLYNAVKLLIEAGKRVKQTRPIVRAPGEDLLPGETEE